MVSPVTQPTGIYPVREYGVFLAGVSSQIGSPPLTVLDTLYLTCPKQTPSSRVQHGGSSEHSFPQRWAPGNAFNAFCPHQVISQHPFNRINPQPRCHHPKLMVG